MASETKSCQNCKNAFTIEPEDFSFYEKIKVPPPTFCPWCRFVRRMVWRNERVLYKRTCNLCEKNIIAMYPQTAPFPVYCRECWYSDKWDATNYGRDYDFSKPFFEQWRELSLVVPRLALMQRNLVNSDFTNMSAESKNVYLSVSVVRSENVFYSKSVDDSFNIFDSYNLKNSDGCYENIDGEKNYNSQYLFLSRNCINSFFLVDCVNCSNCILSSNLRNKEFYIRNKQCSKEEYQREIEKMNLGSRNSREILIKEFKELQVKAIYRFANILRSVDATGNNLLNVKNGHHLFDVYDTENAKYFFRGFYMKDCMDLDFAGKSELLYEYSTAALNDFNVRFSYCAMESLRNADYTESCVSSTNVFGCISVRSHENVILNKMYSKEEFATLRGKIITHMNEMPYKDSLGRTYGYGEFFPIELCAYAYNETGAQEFAPLTKEEALQFGYRWKDPEEKHFTITKIGTTLPDTIAEVGDEILQDVIACSHEGKCNHMCAVAFRITGDELQFYQKNNIPLPTMCPNCRHYERFVQVPPLKLWHRQCMCELAHHTHQGRCTNEFDTPYAPERREKIYCETCYQQEVV